MSMEILPYIVGTVVAFIALILFTLVLAFALIRFHGERNTISVYVEVNNAKVNKKFCEAKGIPFYIKRSRFLHETIYRETLVIYTLTATEKILDSEENLVATIIRDQLYKNVSWSVEKKSIIPLYKKIAELKTETDPDRKLEIWECLKIKFSKLSEYDGKKPTADNFVQQVGNLCKEEVYVDYSTKYFLNASLPLIGSSDITTELSSDGTLSKSTTKIEDNTFGNLLDAFPASKFTDFTSTVTKESSKGDDTEIPKGELLSKPHSTRYEFDITAKYYYVHHILFKYIKSGDVVDSNACVKHQKEISLGCNSAWYRREFVTSQIEIKDQESKLPSEDDKTTETSQVSELL